MPKTTFEIAPLSESDAGAMAALHRTAFTPGWSKAEMGEHARRDLVLGQTEEGGAPISGFIIVSRAGDQAEVLTLVTDPAKRRRGVGGALLRSAESAVSRSGVRDIFLEVAEDNPGAIALYENAGYRRIGRRPGYYRRPGGRVAALTFRKKLDEA